MWADTDNNKDERCVQNRGIAGYDLPITLELDCHKTLGIKTDRTCPHRFHLQGKRAPGSIGQKVNIRHITRESSRDNATTPKFGHNKAFANLPGKLGLEVALLHDEYNCACIL